MLMLPSGTPSIICQRCRLRETLLNLRLRRQARPPARLFTHQSRRGQEFIQDAVKSKDKGYVWRHFDGKGRVIGRPGKRQRAVSEKLSTKALDERVSPSQIIVFQDVRGDTPKPQRTAPVRDDSISQALSAKEIEDSIAGRSVAPEEVEVNASIDELRPSDTIVDENGFKKLKQILMKGYNYGQLSRYFQARTSHRLAPLSYDVHEPSTIQWQAGETPLERRHKNMAKAHKPNSKHGVAEQILRLVWDITVQSEVQGTGELEMKLKPWQRSMLFDLTTSDGRPYFERLITPAILLEASRVYQYQPDNIVRIVGRRQVAEEVAKQISIAVLGIQKLELDLTPFLQPGPRADGKNASQNVFQAADLRYVSDMTKCAVVPVRPDRMAIYGYDLASGRNAQRTLLSLLALQSRSSFDEVSTAGLELTRGATTKTATIMADVMSTGLHRQHRALQLSRVVSPVARTQRAGDQSRGSEGDVEPNKLVEVLERQIDRAAVAINGTLLWAQTSGSYWRNEVRLSAWEAEFCKLLDEKTTKSAGRRRRTKSRGQRAGEMKMQSVLSGSEALLSYFTPVDLPRPLNLQMGEKRGRIVFDRRLPFLNAHFVPCPPAGVFTTKLPHITMRFRFSAPTNTNEPRELRLLGLRAKIDEQRLRVPLPGETMDLCFTRNSAMISNSNLVSQDDDISQFYAHLRESVQFGKGALDAPSSLTIRLPRFLLYSGLEEDAAETGDVEVRYMTERFEQVQSVEFMPSTEISQQAGVDREITDMIKSLPEGCHLDYREVDGGAVHGNSTSLSLHVPSSSVGNAEEPFAMEDRDNSRLLSQDSELESVTQSEAVSRNDQNISLSDEPHNTVDQESQVSPAINVHAPQATTDNGSPAVKETAETSGHQSANPTSGLVAAALRVAGLLTRAHAGTLRRLGER